MEGWSHPEDLLWVVVVGAVAMAYMAWGIGANDVANAFGPAFGAKSLTVKQACMIAAVCEAAGAILMGGHVADTIRKGMMSVELYNSNEGRVLIMAGMTSVLIAAATWLLVASRLGLPVSTTHSAVGGVIAFAISTKGYGSVTWERVGMIVASWFISPLLAGIMGFILYTCVKKLVLEHEDSLRRARLSAPVFVFLITLVLALFTIYKGGKGIGLHKTSPAVAVGASFGIAILSGIAAYPFVQWWGKKALEAQQCKEKEMDTMASANAAAAEGKDDVEKKIENDSFSWDAHLQKMDVKAAEGVTQDNAKLEDGIVLGRPEGTDNAKIKETELYCPTKSDKAVVSESHSATEQLFTGFVVIVAGFFSLAHGANDVANSVGPFGAVLAAYAGPLEKKSEIPMVVFIGAGVMIVVGLATYGVHVMKTIGNNITAMTPSKAFCVNFAATIIVLVATRAGIPVSTTHASVGAVVGVGLSSGPWRKAVNWKLLMKVFFSWILTLPIVGISAGGVFQLFLPLMVGVPFK